MTHPDDHPLQPASEIPSAADRELESAGGEDGRILENLRLQHLMRQAQAIIDVQKTMAEQWHVETSGKQG